MRMYSISQREKNGQTIIPEFEFTLSSLTERQNKFKKNNVKDVFESIWRGGMPAVLKMDEEQLGEYYSSYIDTYLMRDAVDDNGITDTAGFRKVLKACAAFVGNLINYSDLAAAGGVSVYTVKSWVKILQNMGILFLLEPYSNNELKRLVKTPKLYFCDTGLAAYLSMWTSADVLMNGAASGHFFENYVVGEFFRMYSYSAKKTNLTFYRDTNQKEIDLVIDTAGILHPVEIKKSSNPEKKILKSFHVLDKSSAQLGAGGVICMTEKVFPMDANNFMIPCNII